MTGMQGRRWWEMPLAGVGAVSVYPGVSFGAVAVQMSLSACARRMCPCVCTTEAVPPGGPVPAEGWGLLLPLKGHFATCRDVCARQWVSE